MSAQGLGSQAPPRTIAASLVSSEEGPWLVRSSRWLRAVVLLLAAINLTWRLGNEVVGEWDESLYATTAWEMTQSGDIIATTFDGELDYYNSKPPLNVWLLATSFSLFGVSLWALRLPSALAGWLAVYLLQRWTSRAFGPVVSLVSSAVLASSFAFLHEHAARSGNADALLTLAVLLLMVLVSSVVERPWRRVWVGAVLAGIFMLKGAAVLQGLALVAVGEAIIGKRGGLRWKPYLWATLVFIVPVGSWAFARWQIDGWRFFEQMVAYDLLAVSLTQLESHTNGAFYYLDVLQRYHYEWLAAAVICVLSSVPAMRLACRHVVDRVRQRDPRAAALVAGALATVLIPTVMQTRIHWYLTPFYPLFAVAVGWAAAQALAHPPTSCRSNALPVTALVLALIVAESKSFWRIHRVTDIERSIQGLLLVNLQAGGLQRVFRDEKVRSEAFLVRALRGASFTVFDDTGGIPKGASGGDFVVLRGLADRPSLELVGRGRRHSLFRVPRR